VPIVFDGTALPEVIDAPRGGPVIESGSTAALASAIIMLMANRGAREFHRDQGLALVRSRYDEQRYIADHLALYRSLCTHRPPVD